VPFYVKFQFIVLLTQQIENGKCKIENYGVAFGDDFIGLPKVIP